MYAIKECRINVTTVPSISIFTNIYEIRNVYLNPVPTPKKQNF